MWLNFSAIDWLKKTSGDFYLVENTIPLSKVEVEIAKIKLISIFINEFNHSFSEQLRK